MMFNTKANIPAAEISDRIVRLQKRLQARGIDGALILQNVDLYYYSGTIQQCHLYIPCQGKPLLMVYKSVARARAESPIETIVSLPSASRIVTIMQDHGIPAPKTLGMELDVLPVNHYNRYRRLFADTTIVDIAMDIRVQRSIKSPYEIDIIASAAARSDQVAAHAASIIAAGMSELELAGRVEAHARKLGHQGVVRMRMWGGELFYGHLMAGASGAVPSYLASPTGGAAPSPAVAQGAGFDTIQPNEPILIDYVFALNGYISDHTRIFSVGQLPGALRDAHACMLDIQQQLIETAKPGITVERLYDLGITMAGQAGLQDHFMGAEKRRIRFIGHGVGLELDELPIIAQGQETRLEENMVIALEPKVIFPGVGVVGIENTHVVTKDGLRKLGQYPDTVTVV